MADGPKGMVCCHPGCKLCGKPGCGAGNPGAGACCFSEIFRTKNVCRDDGKTKRRAPAPARQRAPAPCVLLRNTNEFLRDRGIIIVSLGIHDALPSAHNSKSRVDHASMAQEFLGKISRMCEFPGVSILIVTQPNMDLPAKSPRLSRQWADTNKRQRAGQVNLRNFYVRLKSEFRSWVYTTRCSAHLVAFVDQFSMFDARSTGKARFEGDTLYHLGSDARLLRIFNILSILQDSGSLPVSLLDDNRGNSTKSTPTQ